MDNLATDCCRGAALLQNPRRPETALNSAWIAYLLQLETIVGVEGQIQISSWLSSPIPTGSPCQRGATASKPRPHNAGSQFYRWFTIQQSDLSYNT